MSSQSSNFLDYGIGEDINPKSKLNSLISVMVSTVMCLASKCPLPKSNVETTKKFLSTITDDNGYTPRNIKNLLSLLNNYSGPYELDSPSEKSFEKPPRVKTPVVKTPVEDAEISLLEGESRSKISMNTIIMKEESAVMARRSPKLGNRRFEKEGKRNNKSLGSKISTSKSMITKL